MISAVNPRLTCLLMAKAASCFCEPFRVWGRSESEKSLMNEFKAWLGQVTTGHGAAVIGGTLLAVLSGSMTWQAAAPVLLGGIVAVLWPENTALATATQTVATQAIQDVPTLTAAVTAVQQAYQTGVAHGNAAAHPAAPSAPAGTAVPPPAHATPVP